MPILPRCDYLLRTTENTGITVYFKWNPRTRGIESASWVVSQFCLCSSIWLGCHTKFNAKCILNPQSIQFNHTKVLLH